MRILGIDPGYAIVGFGILECQGVSMQMLRCGAITTSPELSISQRLAQIFLDVQTLLVQYQPDEVAVEELFFYQNVTTGIDVAQARGVILLAVEQAGVPIGEYTPSQVKQAVTGFGRADKRQMMEMTKTLLHLPAVPKPDDAADALAVAICHARTSGSLLRRQRSK